MYKHVVQDIIIPLNELSRSIDLFHEWFEVYPLLVFPITVFRHEHEGFLRNPKEEDLIPGTQKQMMFDLGVYGVPEKVRRKEPWNAKEVIRAMEKYTRDVGGYQVGPSVDGWLRRLSAPSPHSHTAPTPPIAVFVRRHVHDARGEEQEERRWETHSARVHASSHNRPTLLKPRPQEFREMFNHELYDRVRRRPDIDAVGAFPEVYDKIRPEKGVLMDRPEFEADSKKTK